MSALVGQRRQANYECRNSSVVFPASTQKTVSDGYNTCLLQSQTNVQRPETCKNLHVQYVLDVDYCGLQIATEGPLAARILVVVALLLLAPLRVNNTSPFVYKFLDVHRHCFVFLSGSLVASGFICYALSGSIDDAHLYSGVYSWYSFGMPRGNSNASAYYCCPVTSGR
ncbi:unnamed protein product [Ceratitis capitata]|uniref:(Mediterranean fruit fly) hypothetical protein n=1 Tax=Ceratitis capitata TaxID=7213 RepID=A0A811UI15_CERCA|nr:unnamed protein product [Ceratitis capitata]